LFKDNIHDADRPGLPFGGHHAKDREYPFPEFVPDLFTGDLLSHFDVPSFARH
jgi:hypothetical protein